MVSNKEAIEKTVQKISDIGKNMARGFGEGMFCLPTMIRKFNEKKIKTPMSYFIGAAPIIMFPFGIGLNFVIYKNLFDYDPNLGYGMLGIHISTNIASIKDRETDNSINLI